MPSKKDLSTISIEELQAELEKRNEVEPLFVKNGVKYYDTDGYQKLLNHFDEVGYPTDYTPIEFNGDGSAKSVEPQHVCINVKAFVSNRVRYIPTKKEYHVVFDTRTILEAETGNITLAFIPEYIIKADKGSENGYTVARGDVSREDFLKTYSDAFGIADALKILKIVDDNANALAGSSTIEFKLD